MQCFQSWVQIGKWVPMEEIEARAVVLFMVVKIRLREVVKSDVAVKFTKNFTFFFFLFSTNNFLVEVKIACNFYNFLSFFVGSASLCEN